MAPCWSHVFFLLLTSSAAANPTQQPSVSSQPSAAGQPPSAAGQQPPSAVSYQPSAAEQLSALLGPVVEGAVSRAQSVQLAGRLERLQAGAEAGQRALAELTRQQLRLDTIAHDVTALQLSVLAGGGRGVSPTLPAGLCPPPEQARQQDGRNKPRAGHEPRREPELEDSEPQPELTRTTRRRPVPVPEPEPTPEQETETEPEPPPRQEEEPCEARPTALPAGVAAYQAPAVRACGCSCLQLRHRGVTQDGVYWLTGLPVPALCDFSHDDGGWTLLLTSVSKAGWDPYSVLGRSLLSPSLTDNYSMLKYADAIRDLGTSERFAYRIETQAEKGRQRWGGVWFAPRRYSFIDETATQTDVSLVRRFDNWVYHEKGIKRRMPWINTYGYHDMKPILTTGTTGTNFWGTMVTHASYPHYSNSPWFHPHASDSGTVLYWMREDAF